jgi:hypothetical protein
MSPHFFQRVLWSLVLFSLPLNQLLVSASTEESQRSILLTSSNLLEDVEKRLHDEPNINAEALANYANGLLTEKGFNYDFEVCDAIGRQRLKQSTATLAQIPFSSKVLQAKGQPLNLKFVSTNPADGLCGECFSSIPALRVTKTEMEILSGGQHLHLKRPPTFYLDQAELVDRSMKRVLRTWQLPYQTGPVGISEDGRKLYIPLESGPESLILELSEDGKVQFRSRASISVRDESETIENTPRDRKNAYLGFKRFKSDGQTFVVRFSWPCT